MKKMDQLWAGLKQRNWNMMHVGIDVNDDASGVGEDDGKQDQKRQWNWSSLPMSDQQQM